MFDPISEKKFLDSLVRDYRDVNPYPQSKKEVIFEMTLPYLTGSKEKTGLQLGCSNGYETQWLAKHLKHLDSVDGSSEFVEKQSRDNKNANVSYIYSLFEEFNAPGDGKYDYVFCNYILEHVFEVPPVLATIKRVLKKDGYLFTAVPNAEALSRQLAKQMGLLTDLKELTENDHRHGHRRVYDKKSFVNDLETAGFKVVSCRGVVLKILADFQLNKLLADGFLTHEHIRGLNALGATYPELCDSVFVVSQIA
jgi:2-polyprenyl-3-methyl-5-hydroxy-6-metoxy-1,4-benzoquinol methylase